MRKKDLPNAIALNSIQFNLARVLGPLLAGAALARVRQRVACFGLNGLSFLVVIVALLSLTSSSTRRATEHAGCCERAGRRPRATCGTTAALLALTVLASPTTFLGLPLLTFLPVFAQERLPRRRQPLQPA